jgi:GNAT superfamily N-acetyltransferase
VTLSLSAIAARPDLVTHPIVLAGGEVLEFRPLESTDADALGGFLSALSQETRGLSEFAGYDKAAAQVLCDSINRYDKLRFVIETGDRRIVGCFEISFGIPRGDVERFREAGIVLSELTDCRLGPTLADDYQGFGLGSQSFAHVLEVVRQFGKTRIILWGGVLGDNARAIGYYLKHGFCEVGKFSDHVGVVHLDMILTL